MMVLPYLSVSPYSNDTLAEGAFPNAVSWAFRVAELVPIEVAAAVSIVGGLRAGGVIVAGGAGSSAVVMKEISDP
jgi:hypothetical protein